MAHPYRGFYFSWFLFRFLSKEFHYFEKIYFHITSRSLIRIFSRFRHRISNCIKFILEEFRIQKTKVLKLTSPLPDLETALSRKYIGLI